MSEAKARMRLLVEQLEDEREEQARLITDLVQIILDVNDYYPEINLDLQSLRIPEHIWWSVSI